MKIELPESSLKERLAKGDEAAFTYIFNQYSSRIRQFVVKFVKSPQLTEDITQEIFIKMWEGRAMSTEIKSLEAWLFTLARNHTLNTLKQISKEPAGLCKLLENYRVVPNSIEDKIVEREYMARVDTILASLPERSREIFRLCREEELSYEEVMKALDISRSAVKKHMVRSHKIFREIFGKELLVPIYIAMALAGL